MFGSTTVNNSYTLVTQQFVTVPATPVPYLRGLIPEPLRSLETLKKLACKGNEQDFMEEGELGSL